jgi:BNR repeat-like domain
LNSRPVLVRPPGVGWWALAGLAAIVWVAVAVSGPRPAPYVFEPEPRSISTLVHADRTRHAKLAIDGATSDTLYVMAVVGGAERSRLDFFVSSDGGDTFGPPAAVSDSVSSHGENSPILVGQPGIFAAWNDGADIRFGRSRSWGADFDKPVAITGKKEGAFSGYVTIGGASDGSLYAVWIDTRDGIDGRDRYSVYLARSSDGGGSFGPSVRVASDVCPCCRPNLAFGTRGEVLVFWRHVYAGNERDITVAVSRDRGATFARARRIAKDHWTANECPDSGVATVRAGDRIYAAWLAEGARERGGIHLAWSDDAGGSWEPTVVASQDILDANYPALSASEEGRVLLVFQGRDPHRGAGWDITSPFVVEINTVGNLSRPIAIPGVKAAVSRPAIVAGRGGRLFAAWTSSVDGKPTAFMSRARRAPVP